jgi:hypothetical protein
VGDEAQDRMIGAVAEIQRRSLDAAKALVDRLVSTVDGGPGEPAPASGDAPPAPPPGLPTELVEGWAKLWRDSITSLAATFGGVPPGSAASVLTVDGSASPAPTLVLDLAPGVAGTVEVWVHNPTEEARDGLRPHCGSPRSHDGRELAVTGLAFDPPAFDLPPRSSRGIRLTVEPNGATPGTYRSLVQVQGLNEQWLPIEIRVGDPTA